MTSPDRPEAMRLAISSHDNNKVKLLLRAGVPANGGSLGKTFVECAANFANEEAFELFVEHGVSFDTEKILTAAAGGDSRGGPVSIKILSAILDSTSFNQDALDDALRFACDNGRSAAVVTELLANGADPNAFDEILQTTALINAVRSLKTEIVALLLDAGAEPNRYAVIEERDDDEGATVKIPLVTFALTAGTTDIVKLLVRSA